MRCYRLIPSLENLSCRRFFCSRRTLNWRSIRAARRASLATIPASQSLCIPNCFVGAGLSPPFLEKASPWLVPALLGEGLVGAGLVPVRAFPCKFSMLWPAIAGRRGDRPLLAPAGKRLRVRSLGAWREKRVLSRRPQVWPWGADLAPDALYADVTGLPIFQQARQSQRRTPRPQP